MIPTPKHIQELAPYKPGKPIAEVQKEFGLTNIIKLASNENPFGSSPKAIARMMADAHDLNYYPNGGATLREKLSEFHQVKTENIIVGNGAESILSYAIRTFIVPGDEVLTCLGTFVGLRVTTQSIGCATKFIPLKNYRFDVEALASAITPQTKIVYISNVNNPTGTYISDEEFTWFVNQLPENAMLIFDEAYFEYSQAFGKQDFPNSLHYRFDNVLTIRTFSKVYGIAGFRIGYGVGHSNIISSMMKIRLPFEPNTLAQSAALGALEDSEFREMTVQANVEGITFYSKEFSALGFNPPQSLGNFVMLPCQSAENVAFLYENLLRRGIITRPLEGFQLPECLRVSTGTMEQNRACVHALKEILSENPAFHQAMVLSQKIGL